MDLVTVIIPYFKKKKFIQEAVKSVLNQKYKNIEIIIIYDDEDKRDLNFLRSFKSKKIKIIINKNADNKFAVVVSSNPIHES